MWYLLVQTPDQCYCGNEFGVHGLSDKCTSTCLDDPVYFCGGPSQMMVFRTEGQQQRGLKGGCIEVVYNTLLLHLTADTWPKPYRYIDYRNIWCNAIEDGYFVSCKSYILTFDWEDIISAKCCTCIFHCHVEYSYIMQYLLRAKHLLNIFPKIILEKYVKAYKWKMIKWKNKYMYIQISTQFSI